MKIEKRHKNKYRVITRFIKLVHHLRGEGRALAYLWFFVKDSMVSVVRGERTLLHMMMVKQVIVFEASDLENERNKLKLSFMMLTRIKVEKNGCFREFHYF
jgi:hypothetical protein